MNKHYFEPLTWLRAVAAFFVVISHSLRTSEIQYSPTDEASHFLPLNLLDLGSFGVCLFFALSGCTLFISSHEKINQFGDFFGFYIKRFMRIWPAFAISLFIYLVFIEIFRHFYTADKSFWIAQFLNEYSLQNVFQYLSLTFNIYGPRNLFIGPYWSLPVEFQYYLLLPFALLLMKIRNFGFLSPLLFSAVLYFLFREPVFQWDRDEVFQMGFTFFGGVFLANYHRSKTFRVPFWTSITLFLAVILFIGLVRTSIISIPKEIPFISNEWNLYGVVALTCVLLALFTRQPQKNNRFLNFVHKYGEISYSIYLFHMLFIGIAALLVINFEIYGKHQKLFFVLLFSLTGSYIFSKYTYRYIEQPSISLGRRLSNFKQKLNSDL